MTADNNQTERVMGLRRNRRCRLVLPSGEEITLQPRWINNRPELLIGCPAGVKIKNELAGPEQPPRHAAKIEPTERRRCVRVNGCRRRT